MVYFLLGHIGFEVEFKCFKLTRKTKWCNGINLIVRKGVNKEFFIHDDQYGLFMTERLMIRYISRQRCTLFLLNLSPFKFLRFFHRSFVKLP